MKKIASLSIIAFTKPEFLDKIGLIIELHYGMGMSYRKIVKVTGFSKSEVNYAISKARPRSGKYDITVTIQSAINKKDQT